MSTFVLTICNCNSNQIVSVLFHMHSFTSKNIKINCIYHKMTVFEPTLNISFRRALRYDPLGKSLYSITRTQQEKMVSGT